MNLNEYRLSAIRSSLASKSKEYIHEISESYIEIFKNVQDYPTYYKSDRLQAYSWIQNGTFHLTLQCLDLPSLELTIDNSIQINKELLDAFYTIKGYLYFILSTNSHLFHTVQVTGHSMGGGLATIAAPFIGKYLNTPDIQPVKRADKTKKRIVCHTFGSPRVGNQLFVEWFNKEVDESIRIIIEDDMIPNSPNSSIYTHVSDAICVGDKSIREKPEPKWYWRLFSLRSTNKTYNCNMYINQIAKAI